MITDYGLYYSVNPDVVEINLTLLDMPVDQPYSVITEISIKGNQAIAKRYDEFAKHGFDWFQRKVILAMVSQAVEDKKAGFFVLEDNFPVSRELSTRDSKRGMQLDVMVRSRRLGEDTGKDLVVDWGLSLKRYVERLVHEQERMPADSKAKLAALLRQ